MLQHENEAWTRGFQRIAGVDEAGRGPLAGPVVAAAVYFDPDYLRAEAHGTLRGLTDSKKLTARRRAHFFELLDGCPAIHTGVGRCEVEEIDAVNILQATYRAMRSAVARLPVAVDHLLVDGRPVPGLPCSSTALVGGDGLSLSVAAASVVAKVTRDRIMEELDRLFPAYGFAQHKGYGTRAHLRALQALGPSPQHRRSFGPVRQLALALDEPAGAP